MTETAVALTSLLYGFGSALIPVLNAEAYLAINTAVADRPLAWLVVLTMTAGTAAGKVLIFCGARKGSGVLAARTSRARHQATGLTSDQTPQVSGGPLRTRVRSWSRQLLRFLDDPVKGPLTVFGASVAGIPPLAVVSVLAGASRQSTWLFALAVLLGRGIRFAAIAVPASLAF
ncbi:hypothetical protein [Aeromicrobium sp. CTD01-1L150]|uniref:hypothetical protein n=1 Tax=Aeromicrobium sp. CTD01-1L150 TaxID=3341830 RepID=UPI0035C056EF